MFNIGKSYIVRDGELSKLCADITVSGRMMTLWFSVDSVHEDWLMQGRADAFVMALLPAAMRGQHDIICEDPMSERLHSQLIGSLIPALTFSGDLYHEIRIDGPLTTKAGYGTGVGTGFSSGADSLHTVMGHGKDSEFPLTHIAVFGNGHVDKEDLYNTLCEHARRFAEEQGLGLVMLNSNMHDAFGERFLDVYSFRNYACAMALGNLFKAYLLSSGHDAAHFKIDLRNSASFDLLTSRCVSTEYLTFYHSGEEATRIEKLAALAQWEPSWHTLHPCFKQGIGYPNCGHCKKDIRDMTTFYALGYLDRYRAVYDVDDYLEHLPQRLGVLLAHGDGHLYDETIRLLEEHGIEIPKKAYLYEKQFRMAMRHLEAGKQGGAV